MLQHSTVHRHRLPPNQLRVPNKEGRGSINDHHHLSLSAHTVLSAVNSLVQSLAGHWTQRPLTGLWPTLSEH